MAKFSESVIEEIKEKTSIVEVVSKYLTLNKKGDRYWGLCPFHTEKTPSFSVLPDKGFFHCFGCGKSGSIFDFVMEMEHLTFPEALKQLAESVGVTVQEESEADKKRRDAADTLRQMYGRLAAGFHYILLETSHGAKARAYLEHRNISPQMQQKFLLGYAPADPDWLYRFLLSKHYSEHMLAQTGLFAKNNPTYPLFRDRLMFPIRDWKGNCVAFGGRDLSGQSKAKYINTPETALFRKREIVYGMFESLDGLKKTESCYLCEGYFDVIAMHQAGMGTAMAPLGTAFTLEQGRLVRRYAKQAGLLFDSDSAGQQATKKTLTLCESIGFESRVILLESAKDPAELLETSGAQALTQACKASRTAFDYLVYSALNLYDAKKPKGKLQVLNEVKPYLDAVDSEIVRQEYLRSLSDRLAVDISVLMKDYRPQRRVPIPAREIPAEEKPVSWSRSIDLYCMVTLVNNRRLFASYRNKLKIEELVDDHAATLYTVIEDASRAQQTISDEMILQMIDFAPLRQMVALSFQTGEFIQQPEVVLDEAVKRIRLRKLESKRKQVEQLLRIAETEASVVEDMSELLLEKKALDEEIANMRNPEHV